MKNRSCPQCSGKNQRRRRTQKQRRRVIFGSSSCKRCKELQYELDQKGEEYTYYDIETAEGLAEAASRNLIGQSLPIVIEERESDY